MTEQTPAVRLVADGARAVALRPAAIALGLAGRLGAPVHVAWPDLDQPSVLLPARATQPVRWVRERFQPEARRPRGVSAATWVALRSGGALVGGRPGLAVRLAERVLERPLEGAVAAMWAASADRGAKANAFVFERAAAEPVLVVKMLAEARRTHRLEREVEMIAAVRERLAGAPDVADVLPLPTLFCGEFEGERLTAERVDPLGGLAADDPRERVSAWLAGLHRATSTPRPWTADDTDALVDVVRRGWPRLRPDAAEAVVARTAELLRALEGAPVPRGVQHGDLWRGNVAVDGTAMRVYDWEWTELDAAPFADLWTYDIAEIRHFATHGHGRQRPLEEAVAGVAAQLRERGVDERFALATLPAVAAQLTFRSRWEDGPDSGSEEGSIPLFADIERLLGSA